MLRKRNIRLEATESGAKEPQTTTEPSRVAQGEEGIWGEATSQEGLRGVAFRRPLPMPVIDAYVRAAVDRAVAVQHEDGGWFAEIPGLPGVWAKESSQKKALDVLQEVVFESVLLKIRDEDRDLPVLESLDLNAL